MAVGDALRRLLEEIGWSYAVFWKAVGAADPVHLVHIVGEGTVGRAAFTGNHQWIAHGTANGHGLSSEVAAEMNNQFKAGIQTIAIIPVLPRGVLQLGSTGLVMENTNFVMYAKKLCTQLNNRSGMTASASVKNATSQHGQPCSLYGTFHVQRDDHCSKISS